MAFWSVYLSKERRKTKTYRDRVVPVTSKLFRRPAIEQFEEGVEVVDIDNKERIFPAHVLDMRYIKDARYVPRDTTTESEGLNKPKRTTCSSCRVGLCHHVKIMVVSEFSAFQSCLIPLSTNGC